MLQILFTDFFFDKIRVYFYYYGTQLQNVTQYFKLQIITIQQVHV